MFHRSRELLNHDAVLALFANMQDNVDTLDANQGMGMLGWWPPEGDHGCMLTHIELAAGKYKYGPFNAPKECPSAQVTFHYRLLEDPDAVDGVPRAFKGRYFNIAAIPANQLPENKTDGQHQMRMRIEKERLLGHLATLLGAKPSNWQQGLSEALAKLNAAAAANTSIMVKVRCAYRLPTEKGSKTPKPGAVKIPDNEYLVELLSGVAAPAGA